MAYRQSDMERKALREEQKHAEGLISERYPQVLRIVIHMTYNRKGVNPVLLNRTMYFYPETYAYFHMDCLTSSCENGGYDLAPVIRSMIREGKESEKGDMVCTGERANLRQDHGNISYEIDVEYE